MKRYKIIKATDGKLVGVIFEYAIINDMKPPKWFSEFVDKQFKPLVQKVDVIVTDVADLKVRMTNVEKRLDNLVKKNDLVE